MNKATTKRASFRFLCHRHASTDQWSPIGRAQCNRSSPRAMQLQFIQKTTTKTDTNELEIDFVSIWLKNTTESILSLSKLIWIMKNDRLTSHFPNTIIDAFFFIFNYDLVLLSIVFNSFDAILFTRSLWTMQL